MRLTTRWALIAVCGLLASCSSDSTGPPPGVAGAGSAFVDGSYSAELRYFNDHCRAASVDATGPGASGSVSVGLVCSSDGVWEASIPLGASHPASATAYVFTIDDGQRVFQRAATIPCWQESLPTAIAPNGTVASPVTFQWTSLPVGSGIEYTVWATRTSTGNVTKWPVVDQNSATQTLAPGPYTWFVDAIAVGGHEPASSEFCSARSEGPAFTVQ